MQVKSTLLNSCPKSTDSVTFDIMPSESRRDRALSWQKPLFYLFLVLLGSGLTLASSYFVARYLQPSSSSNPAAPPIAGIAPGERPGLPIVSDPNFVTTVVEQVGPAVVRIDAARTVATQFPGVFQDPLFRQFFGSRFPIPPSERVERGTGSGFITSSDGQILTNAHVVKGADTVTVILKDGRSFDGKVLGVDTVTDLAAIKIEATDLPSVTLGDSDRLKPGQWAIAIGNPLGLDNTVTTGIISATGRSSSEVGIPDKRVNFVQTDAAINPGNSGGPLLNQHGEVIGINTAIIQGAQGLGFAIPINTAQSIAEQLVATGKAEHPYLGIQMVTLTPEIQQNINRNPNSRLTIDADRGVLIASVVPDSPAARAGLRAGDVIQQIDGDAIADTQAIQKHIAKIQVGENLQLLVRRNQQDIEISVTVEALPTALQ